MATEEEIQHAAITAQAADFIAEMKEAIKLFLLKVARIYPVVRSSVLRLVVHLLANRTFICFDDSFSALDFKTDAKLRAALKTETEHATMIIVAQRVSTIMDANQIIVLDEGQIAG